MACSLDGFIAGPQDELDWLGAAEGTEDTFSPFLATVGSMLMGRRTYDVVSAFEGPWPYGEMPVLVATGKTLNPAQPTVRSVSGPVEAMVAHAKEAAGERNVYIDGGSLIRSALSAGLVDKMTLTLIPIVLGRGLALFAGMDRRHRLELLSERSIGGGLVELCYRPLPQVD